MNSIIINKITSESTCSDILNMINCVVQDIQDTCQVFDQVVATLSVKYKLAALEQLYGESTILADECLKELEDQQIESLGYCRVYFD